MKYDVPMPSLGADMDQGKLMKWMIKPGNEVKKGQTIAVVETTKSTVEIESFRDGKVLELVGKEGDEINVGKTIAYFDVPGTEAIRETPPVPLRMKVSPAARRLADEKGIDLNKVKGSGPEGQIELKDVEELGEKKGVNLREAIAKAMSRSKKEIPHYYLKTSVNLNKLLEWIDHKNQILSSEERLLIPVVFLRAMLLAVREHPKMNGYYEHGKFEQKKSIHLGVAIAFKGEGVMVPALMEAETQTLSQLNSAFQDLLVRTRKGELKNRELTEGTITITNVGDLGSDEVFGIIFPPQVALVGIGRIRKEPIVEERGVIPGFVVDVTLSADHRVTDGLAGARFLQSIQKYLMNPNLLEDLDERTGNQISSERNLPSSGAGDSV